MSQAGIIKVASEILPPSVVETITGNDGVHEAAVANNFNFLTANTTVKFLGTTGTESLDFGLFNLILGNSATSITTATQNVGIGRGLYGSLTQGAGNTFTGYNGSGPMALTTGMGNSGFGRNTLGQISTGQENLALGDGSGANYTANDSFNVSIANAGVSGESGATRIGTIGQQNAFYGAGIGGVSVATPQIVTINPSTGQMGSETSSALFTPNAVLQLSDDFFSVQPASGYLSSQLTWDATGNFIWQMSTATATIAHPGVISHTSMTSAVRTLLLGQTASSAPGGLLLGGGAVTLNWVFNIVNASNSTNRYTLALGLTDTTASASIANGVWFQYSDNLNSGQWNYNTSSASTPTNSTSSIAVTTGWHNAQIVINAAGTSASFFIDGVSLGSANTTNIPTTGIMPFFNVIWSAGTIAASSLEVDLFYLTQTLTTAR